VADGDKVAQPVKVCGPQRTAVVDGGEFRPSVGLPQAHSFSKDPDSNLTKSLTGALPAVSSPRPVSLASGCSRLSEWTCGAARWPIGAENCPSSTADTRCYAWIATVAFAATLRMRFHTTSGGGIGGKGPRASRRILSFSASVTAVATQVNLPAIAPVVTRIRHARLVVPSASGREGPPRCRWLADRRGSPTRGGQP
jgi:hypothetical protein